MERKRQERLQTSRIKQEKLRNEIGERYRGGTQKDTTKSEKRNARKI